MKAKLNSKIKSTKIIRNGKSITVYLYSKNRLAAFVAPTFLRICDDKFIQIGNIAHVATVQNVTLFITLNFGVVRYSVTP